MAKPTKPPGKPGISSSSSSVTLIGTGLSLDQADRVIEQTLELSQNIPISGIPLIMAKSHVTVYFGTMVHHINTSGPMNINVGETFGVSAAAYDANNIVILGRPMSVTTSDPTKVRINSTFGTSGAFNVSITGMAAGQATLTYTCDGVTATEVITCVAVSSGGLGELLFLDNNAGGQRAGGQNGVGWTTIEIGGASGSAYVTPDPTNASGYSMAVDYSPVAFPGDNRIELQFTLPDLPQYYIQFRIKCASNYKHWSFPPANNNKLLRTWDRSYGDSVVHLGCSTQAATKSTLEHLTSCGLVGEYGWDPLPGETAQDAQTGNHSMGPYTTVFQPDRIVTIGIAAKVESAKGVKDGRIRTWVDGLKKSDRLINTWHDSTYPGHGNFFGRGHIFGACNSGFDERTIMLLQEFSVYTDVPAGVPA